MPFSPAPRTSRCDCSVLQDPEVLSPSKESLLREPKRSHLPPVQTRGQTVTDETSGARHQQRRCLDRAPQQRPVERRVARRATAWGLRCHSSTTRPLDSDLVRKRWPKLCHDLPNAIMNRLGTHSAGATAAAALTRPAAAAPTRPAATRLCLDALSGQGCGLR